MNKHAFIFSEGLWIGEGKITFTGSKEHIRFYTKWTVGPLKSGLIMCQQQVEMDAGTGTVYNHLTFSDFLPNKFNVELSSDQLKSVKGTGIIDEKTIAWEFRGLPDFEGFEVYELQENGDYMLHAEYVTLTHMRTVIEGRIWQKK
jgi:hypothetical protein